MNYWILKSEPTSYSVNMLEQEKNQTTAWDGVRNYQARNFMRDHMKKGDLAFFYHSSCKEVGIVGIVTVVRESYWDLTALDTDSDHYDPKSTPENPRWVVVDVRLLKKFSAILPLRALKQNPLLKRLTILQKGNRLSVTPVDKRDWDVIVSMSKSLSG